MSKTKFPKSVSFNTKNANDQLILKHVKRRNFSGYVKKLILADIGLTKETKLSVEQTTEDSAVFPKQKSAAEKLASMQEQLKKGANNINSNPDSSTDS